MENKFRIEHSLKNDYLMQMLQLDDENYEEIDAGTYELCMNWYSINSEIYTILLVENEVAGYINFLPLKKEVYNKFVNGVMRDTELTSEDIEPFTVGKEHNCLLMSVVVKNKFRNGEAVKTLTEAFLQKIKNFNDKNIIIKSMLADCVSVDGEKYIKRLGLSKVKQSLHDTAIYEKEL